HDVVEEGAELRAAQLGASIRYRLHEPLQVQLRGEGEAGPLDSLQRVGVCAEPLLRLPALRDVALHPDVELRLAALVAHAEGCQIDDDLLPALRVADVLAGVPAVLSQLAPDVRKGLLA